MNMNPQPKEGQTEQYEAGFQELMKLIRAGTPSDQLDDLITEQINEQLQGVLQGVMKAPQDRRTIANTEFLVGYLDAVSFVVGALAKAVEDSGGTIDAASTQPANNGAAMAARGIQL